MMQDVKQLTINAIRVLSAEAIQKANSGHPGLPLGAAPIGYAAFTNMTFNPKDTAFDNRDRFVLSAGHGSMLDYALYYLFGFGLTKEEIMNFRQLGSRTAGHPEYGVCPGVETSTGPLGQGIANAVGMAIAENYLAEKFNKEGFPIVDHYTYALCGDGCMQEGIENEAASLAGALKLGKLIVLYDDNDITIEGNTDITFTEDVGKRHEAMGWQVIKVKDANDIGALNRAIKKAKAEKNKPSLIVIQSVIGFGSHLAGNAACHGAPLGEEGVATLKKNLEWNYEPFEVPEEVFKHCKKFANKGRKAQRAWKAMFKAYEEQYPELAKEYKAWKKNELPDLKNIEELWQFEKDDASRGYSSTVLNKLAKYVPQLIGGSADLAPANKSNMKSRGDFGPNDKTGSNMHFGIREHAMAAIVNGMYLHGSLIPYCATFAVFSDYMKNAMRMSALMELPVIYILSHDSIGVGEDGPTHQPIEHLSGLRAMPNMKVYRPADGRETTASWIGALTGKEPACIVVSRQTLPMLDGTGEKAFKGGYILADSTKKTPDVILIATGSEVTLAVNAKKALAEQGVDARVVSMPCVEEFEKQSEKYKESVLPKAVRARVAVEAGATMCWYKYVGMDGKVVGIDEFGASAPAKKLFEKYGFTVENVVNAALEVVKK
ncbi:MAG: transketolase [Clostridiales bacterium]|nr:transketolase [Clostridiales bacterium]